MNKMKNCLCIAFSAFLFLSPHVFGYGRGIFFRLFGAEAKICATVVDDDGKPVEDAEVTATYRLYHTGWGDCVNNVTCLTDAGGRADLTGRCDEFDAWVIAEKEGFYRTCEERSVKSEDNPDGKGIYTKWGKWNPYGVKKTYVLKEIRNPVPLVVFRDIAMSSTEFDKEFGFDLEYGDFVKPYGDGEVADFYVKFEWDEDAQNLVKKMTMTFPNALDGAYICPYYEPSRLKSPYRADEEAQYLKEFVFSKTRKRDPKEGFWRIVSEEQLAKDQGLILRTRTKVDADGTLVSAHYSKIYSQFDIGGYFPELEITNGGITTFFNPVENDTNLECDGKSPPELRKGKRENKKKGSGEAL